MVNAVIWEYQLQWHERTTYSCFINVEYSVKPLNFAKDLILLILQEMYIREIKYPQKFNLYIWQ